MGVARIAGVAALVTAGASVGACGDSDSADGTGGATTGASMSAPSATNASGSQSTGASMSTGSSGAGGAGSSGTGIGEWTDAPGVCPTGTTQIDITTADELSAAARSEDPPWSNDSPATCYFIHDGDYTDPGVLLYIERGGEPAGTRRVFVGESRAGVVIHSRASVAKGVGDLTIENLTLDIGNYGETDAYNTLDLQNGAHITVDHVSFVGDCQNGHSGGHIETNGTDDLLVEACLIEAYGTCGAAGHQDHGIYLASGKNLVIRNNDIVGNASRGIQLYTQQGDYGTLDNVMIERNHIHENGHGDQEDGIVINSSGTGTISNVTIRRNVFDHNFFSAIRFVGGLESAIVVTHNTFVANSAGSSADNRSEINIDEPGGGAGTSFSENLFEVGNTLINDCYDGASLGFTLSNDFVHGSIATGAQGNCVSSEIPGDPMLVDLAGGDFHPQNAAAMAFGAYAP